MILEPLHTTINAVINAYPQIGEGTLTRILPFVACYSADQTVLRSKAGVEGYEYTIRISVVSDQLNECTTKRD